MVSCTEFIPMYSELFKFIDQKGGGHDAVERYWVWVGEKYLRYNLEPLVQEKGMDGAWEYWTRSLSEEACDIKFVYDRDHEEIKSHMRHCPSRGIFSNIPGWSRITITAGTARFFTGRRSKTPASARSMTTAA